MPTTDVIHRVRIYVSESDRWEGQPLYLAVLERLRQEGATGATALRGLAGFGPGHRTRVAAPTSLNEHPPVVVEWVDRADRIARTLALFDDMLANTLITIEDVHLYRATLRRQGRFAGERSVGDIMQRQPQTIAPTATLDEALRILLSANQNALPVVDDQRRVVGVIGDQELMRRAGLRLPIRLLRLLTDGERSDILTPVAGRAVAEVMSAEMRTIYASAAIPQALVTMIEWNYDQIPVIDRQGTLVGLLDQQGILHASVTTTTEENNAVRDAEPPAPVHLVMQTNVPQTAVSQSLAVALEQLLATSSRYLVVVDAAGRLQGCLTDGVVLQQLDGDERLALLAALQREQVSAEMLPGVDRGIEQVIERNIAVLAPTDSINDAARRLLELQLERAPVVDTDSKLCGLIARGGVLRAFVQESD